MGKGTVLVIPVGSWDSAYTNKQNNGMPAAKVQLMLEEADCKHEKGENEHGLWYWMDLEILWCT